MRATRARPRELAVNAETTRSSELLVDRVIVPPGHLVLVFMLSLLGMSVLVVSWVTAIAHVDDDYAIDHVSGTQVHPALPLGERLNWYSRYHFGEEIVHAIERRYRPAEHVDGY